MRISFYPLALFPCPSHYLIQGSQFIFPFGSMSNGYKVSPNLFMTYQPFSVACVKDNKS